MEKSIDNVNIIYCCSYVAEGICKPDPDFDKILLRDDKILVRLLGLNAYKVIVDRMTLPVGKKNIEEVDEKNQEKIQLRRNTLIGKSRNNAVIYVESSLPAKTVVNYSDDKDDELPAYVKAPLKSDALLAFKSASSAMTLARADILSKDYDFIFDQYYMEDDECHILQMLNPVVHLSDRTMSKINNEEIEVAVKLSSIFHQDNRISEILEIYAESLTAYKNGNLHAFIAAWTALEIFVAKKFKDLQSKIEINIDGIGAHKNFSERMLTVMNDKYRLADKFAAISHFYDRENADKDIEEFKKINAARNNFFHKMEGAISDLPLDGTRNLFTKYLRLYVVEKNKEFAVKKSAS